ncbi:hypothetical protein IV38_GL000078 [Lactobacillus selangorensis]|uniref:Alpha beta hydrolase superfamily protein n=1 Tax=Lactobacillus selangorensis TaxID=81857 RepID=A0A0R2FLW4_9LACO|nr:hypothetical protein IV38_GL000078 [Lactobacillus selangorensis]
MLLAGIIALGWWFLRIGRISKQPLVTDQADVAYQTVPTVFVHGYSGNRLSFGRMLARFEHLHIAKKEIVFRVRKDGTLLQTGHLSHRRDNPTVQVLFEDNRADEQKQSLWIARIMNRLKNNEGADAVNLVGHSMGGVSILRYLIVYGRNPHLPQTPKMVAIGAPFNDLELGKDGKEVFVYQLTDQGPSHKAPIYQFFEQRLDALPRDLSFLNIAGNQLRGGLNDGSVAVESSFAIRFLLQKRIKSYQQVVIRGARAAHSLLHENTVVDHDLTEFLWEPTDAGGN